MHSPAHLPPPCSPLSSPLKALVAALLLAVLALAPAGCALPPAWPGDQNDSTETPAAAGTARADDADATGPSPGRSASAPTGVPAAGAVEAVEPLDLHLGDCFAFPPAPGSTLPGDPGEGDGSVHRMSCSAPHSAQAYAVATIQNADLYPEAEELRFMSETLCTSQRNALDQVRVAAVPGLKSMIMVPSAESWSYGDRRILCYVWMPGPQYISGSLMADDD